MDGKWIKTSKSNTSSAFIVTMLEDKKWKDTGEYLYKKSNYVEENSEKC